ncbi:glycosylhydrolase-like jelly roll fold domain-containing protein [Allokutzneria sp. NRRL B-24872]|uniref:glycosylhydrolase-like jelly roll fold domain-containing protein n=1 Tax=Allokutzneria sp. NRRL B-24872 TaxID=1137961 RepID=UPI000A39D2C3|nr:glycosylhydrolase-like jelly roll fold domain-containing protein [Allokutzneria sp. NRRL B-24872]
MNDRAPRLSRRAVLALSTMAALTPEMPAFAAPNPLPDSGFLAQRFAGPRPDSTPSLLWFWNGTVTTDLVTTQLADIRDKGVREVLVFPFDTKALRPAFFTEEWFSLIEFTLREAQRHGMRLWLFNDDYFPSGRGGGFVVNGGKVGERVYPPRPELGMKGVGHQPTTVTGGAPVRVVARGISVWDGKLEADAAIRDGVTLLREGAQWRDYDVVARVRVNRHTAGLVVRCADEGHCLLADLRTDGAVDIWRLEGTKYTLVRPGTPVSGFDPKAFHELKIGVRGSRVSVIVDGLPQPHAEDATFLTGRVGVRAVATQKSSWDSLTVLDPSGNVLFGERFDTSAALDSFELPTTPLPLVAASARPMGSSDPASVIDLTEIARAGGEWSAPPGQWRLDLFTLRTFAAASGALRGYLDLMDDTAVSSFLDVVPGEYLRRFPWAVGTVLRGFADDEPFLAATKDYGPSGTAPWSASLDGELARLKVQPGIALTAVHDDLGPEGLRLRGAFWRAVSNRVAAAYHRGQGEWMARNRLEFVSNPMWDEFGPGRQVKGTGNLNTANQWAQVPGTDLVFDQYQKGLHRILPRWPASTAHQLRLERVYLEAMGATGWQVSPALTREVIGAFAARGVNHTMLHAAFTDSGQIVYPPPFQPVNPWWGVSRPLTEWIGRLMEACRAPVPVRTAILQPQRAAESYQDTAELAGIDAAFVTATHALEDVQVDFDYLDEGALDADPALREHAKPTGPRLAVGRQAYRIVVLPQTPMIALGAVRTLTRFARGGGMVIAIGQRPSREAGGDHAGLSRALNDLLTTAVRVDNPVAAAKAVVAAGGAAAVLNPPTAQVRVLRLERDGQRAFVVMNERAVAADLTATFPATGSPEIWDPDTGTAKPALVWDTTTFPGEREGGTAVSLRIEPKATLVVVFKPGRPGAHAISSSAPVERVRIDEHGASATVRATAPGSVAVVATDGRNRFQGTTNVVGQFAAIPLDGDWSFRFDRPGAPATTRPLGSWTTVDGAHSGSAWYERAFDIKVNVLDGRRWTLDLGTVHEVAEIVVNGTTISARLWAPYRVEVTDALLSGRNRVRVRVTNTGANARGQVVLSGLIGPVSLVPHGFVDVPLTRAR